MRLLGLLLALLLVAAAGSAHASVSQIQGGCNTENGGTASATVACTLGAGVAAGDMVPLFVVSNSSVASISSVVDDKSDSCTIGTTITGSTVNLTPVYCSGLTAGAKTFTATLSSSATLASIIVDGEYSPVTTPPVPVSGGFGQAQTTPGTGSNAITTGTPSLYGATYYWKFDENTGTSLGDAADSDTGTFQGTTGSQWITGKINSGLAFNGTDNYVSTAKSLTEPTVFSISLWFKTSSSAGHKIFGIENTQTGTGATQYDANIWVGTDGKLYFGCFNSGFHTVNSSGTVNNGAWHHAVAIANGSTLQLYLDNASQGTTSTSIAAITGYWRVGAYKLSGWTNGSDGYFTGDVDEIGIWSRALSSSEVSSLYNSGSGNQYPFGLSGTLTPGGLVVAAAVNATGAAGAGTISAGTGFTSDQSVTNLLRSEYQVTNSGTIAGTFTAGNASDSFLSVALEFNPGVAASKLQSYAVLSPCEMCASKLQSYAVLSPGSGSGSRPQVWIAQ